MGSPIPSGGIRSGYRGRIHERGASMATPARATFLSRAVAAVGAGTLMGALAACTSLPDPRPSSAAMQVSSATAQPTPPSASAGDLLGEFPGFGVEDAQVLRDDTIALWEAWQRDVVTAACMVEVGFTWMPEVLYPSEDMVRIAEHVGALAPGEVHEPPLTEGVGVDANLATRATLSEGQLDAYYQALVGESAADIRYLETNGGAEPEHRADGTFAEGGCAGQSLDEVGSLWDVKRHYAEEVLKGRDEFAQAHQAELTAQTKRSRDHYEQALTDDAFQEFLRHRIAGEA